ncbi:MAG: hypothetical protein K6U80_11840 [Firmicutes bacterium]|nr:hypothetical protein [Bacillota bacterium]
MSKRADSNLNLRMEPDRWAKMLPNLALITLCLGSISIGIAILSLPWFKSFLSSAFKLNLRAQLDLQMLEIDFCLIIMTFIISIISMGIQSKRSRRRNDRKYRSFAVFGVLSVLMAAGYLGYIWWGR